MLLQCEENLDVLGSQPYSKCFEIETRMNIFFNIIGLWLGLESDLNIKEDLELSCRELGYFHSFLIRMGIRLPSTK